MSLKLEMIKSCSKPAVLLVSLLLAQVAIAAEESQLPEIRLSGTVNLKHASHAYIEYREGGVTLVKTGDRIDAWGEVIRIEAGKIIVETDDGDVYAVDAEGIESVSGADNQEGKPAPSSVVTSLRQPAEAGSLPATPVQVSGGIQNPNVGAPAQHAVAREVNSSAELMSEIHFLTRQGSASSKALNERIVQMLDLAPSAKIVEVNHNPLSEDASTLLEIEEMLESGSVVRLTIEGDQGVDSIYLAPDPESQH